MSRKIPASEYMGYDKYIEDEYIVKRNPNLIEIPDNATNGNVIEMLFPKVRRHSVVFKLRFLEMDWWNAPYKREGDGE